ncbi:hypothetical protein JYQ73_14935, partial [Anaerostipes hadrus]|nr:hypothetical protein [Anaerostipes hadrus]
ENRVKLSHQAPTLYDVVPKEAIAEFAELMCTTIADIVSEASIFSCWLSLQNSLKHTPLNELLQEFPFVGPFLLAFSPWFFPLMVPSSRKIV